VPTYEYECDACRHAFEEFQQISDSPLRTCPKCRKRKLRRVIGTGAAVIFRGNGFYQTDYRSKEYKDKAKADKDGASKTTSDASKDSSTSSKKTKDTGAAGKKDS